MENKQLAIFKIDKDQENSVDETLIFCSYAKDNQEVFAYLNAVQKQINESMNYEFEGDYIVLPVLHFNIKRQH